MDIDAALDDIERVVVDGDMRQEARAQACEQLEALADELSRRRADNARLRTALLDITGYYLHDAITQASDAALIAVYEIARRAVTPLDTAA